MAALWIVVGIILVLIVLGDAFETIILPRRVTRQISFARLYYQSSWFVWSRSVRLFFSKKHQETYLSFYGPLSLIVLLLLWATGLIIGFALVHWASGSTIKTPDGLIGLGSYIYLSGTSFFTLGMGDVVPASSLGRGLIAFEAGMGFGFLALIIGFLPVLNQSFSRREVNISLLDARAGSPPTAGEMLRRHSHDRGLDDLKQLLHEWERWSADLLESHLSYPVLAYFRSQHDNLSWLAALTAILDTSAFASITLEGPCKRQAELTFAITRHAIVDLARIFNCQPIKLEHDRLPPKQWMVLCAMLNEAGMALCKEAGVEERLTELRKLYEPYASSLSKHLHVAIPPWIPKSSQRDNWQTSAWGKNTGFQIEGPEGSPADKHF